MNYYRELHKTLIYIRFTEAWKNAPQIGICHLVQINGFEPQIDWGMYENWPHYSGCPVFPVPSTDDERHETNAYLHAHGYGTMWKGDYGELRLNLLDHLIVQCEQELKRQEKLDV